MTELVSVSMQRSTELNNLVSAEITLCQETPAGQSSIAGKVIDAVSGAGLSDVQVVLRPDQDGTPGTAVATARADADGTFLFTGLAAGTYHIAAAHQGYIDNSRTVVLGEHVEMADQDLVLSPVLADNEIRIVLTWNQSPADLEAISPSRMTSAAGTTVIISTKRFRPPTSISMTATVSVPRP